MSPCVLQLSLYPPFASLTAYKQTGSGLIKNGSGAYKQTPHPLSSPLFVLPPILRQPCCDMNPIIESRRGDLTHSEHSSSDVIWILAACASTYSVHDVLHRLTRADHCVQYSFYLARELFSTSLIAGVLRRHPSQLRRTTVSTRPPPVSPALLWGVIRGCVNCTPRKASHRHVTITTHRRFQQRRRWWPVWPAAPGKAVQ